MAKNPTNGNVKIAWILDSAYPIKDFPLASTLNGALDLSPAISFKNFTLGPDKSADIDDRSIADLGKAVTRGIASYGAGLSMFRNKDNTDASALYQQAFQAFRVGRTLGWLLVRVGKLSSLPWAAGDEFSPYKFIADTVGDDTNGDDSVKFAVKFLPQARLYPHSIVGGAGVITGVPASQALTVAAGPFQLAPVLAGASIVSRAVYTSSDITKATVSKGGVVTPIAAGTVTITVSHGAATGPIANAITLT